MAAAVLMASAGVLLMLALSNLGWPVRAVVWGGLAMAAYGYGIICLVAVVRGPGQGLASWRLGPWMMLWCGTFFGLATVTWSQGRSGARGEIALSSVLRALWLVAVGATVGPGLCHRAQPAGAGSAAGSPAPSQQVRRRGAERGHSLDPVRRRLRARLAAATTAGR